MTNVPYHEPVEWIHGQPEKAKDTVLLVLAGREDLHGHAKTCPSIRDEECDAVRCTEDGMNLPIQEEYYIEDLLIPDYGGPVVLRLRVLRSPVKDDEFILRWNGILRYVCVLGDWSRSAQDGFDQNDEESSNENSPDGPASSARDNGDGDEAESDDSDLSSSSGSDSNNSDASSHAPGAPCQCRLLGIPVALSAEVTICPLLCGSLTAGSLYIRQSTWLGRLNQGLLKACNYHQRYAQGFAAAKAIDDSDSERRGKQEEAE